MTTAAPAPDHLLGMMPLVRTAALIPTIINSATLSVFAHGRLVDGHERETTFLAWGMVQWLRSQRPVMTLDRDLVDFYVGREIAAPVTRAEAADVPWSGFFLELPAELRIPITFDERRRSTVEGILVSRDTLARPEGGGVVAVPVLHLVPMGRTDSTGDAPYQFCQVAPGTTLAEVEADAARRGLDAVPAAFRIVLGFIQSRGHVQVQTVKRAGRSPALHVVARTDGHLDA